MTLSSRNARRLTVAGVLICCTALLGSALASAAAPIAKAAAVPACTSANTRVWLGDGGGGATAGRTYYPLEFSNVGHHSCTLYGYPGVSAWSGGAQVSLPATRSTASHATVTIKPAGTANAQIAIVDWGAICTTAVNADGLKVYPPGQTVPQEIQFPFQTCASSSTLRVGPITAGVGIPGYPNL
ncbi:MAG: DUF4232 domain-containing protein [Solirubrobacteraceae bacterium]|jgi:hypothetical protein